MGIWVIQELLLNALTLLMQLKDHIMDVDVGARQMRNQKSTS